MNSKPPPTATSRPPASAGQDDFCCSGPVPACGEPWLLPEAVPLAARAIPAGSEAACSPPEGGLFMAEPGMGRLKGVSPGSGVNIELAPGFGVTVTGATYFAVGTEVGSSGAGVAAGPSPVMVTAPF